MGCATDGIAMQVFLPEPASCPVQSDVQGHGTYNRHVCMVMNQSQMHHVSERYLLRFVTMGIILIVAFAMDDGVCLDAFECSLSSLCVCVCVAWKDYSSTHMCCDREASLRMV